METEYQSIIDKLFGPYYKHRTLRTVFDPYSEEWKETNIEEKMAILKKILNSKKISLNELVFQYKMFYTESLSNKKYVADSVEDGLIILLKEFLKN